MPQLAMEGGVPRHIGAALLSLILEFETAASTVFAENSNRVHRFGSFLYPFSKVGPDVICSLKVLFDELSHAIIHERTLGQGRGLHIFHG